MDWNLKVPSWDLTGVDEATLPSIETMDESSSFGGYGTNGDFSVDLKLGQVGNSSTESALTKAKDGSKMASSTSGSSKRARAINNGNLTVSCLVDGCNSDLSTCRDYHRRHKVCELHSKTPEVTIGGLKQRFCQQCSRFHSLEQFDEGKRSCRKRLDGHNRRRRKPQAEPVTRPGSFLSNYQGTQLLSFSSSHVYASTAMVNPAWNGGHVTSCGDAGLRLHNQHHQVHLVDKQNHFLGSSSTSYNKEEKQLPFLQCGNSSTPTLHSNNNSLSESGDVRSKMFCDNNLTSSLHDSPRALSLLSSSQTHTSGNGLSQLVQPHSMHDVMHPLGLSLQDNSLVPNGSDQCSSMYNMGSDGSHGNEAPQLFPFQWD